VWVSLDRGLQILNTCGIIEAKFEFSPNPAKLQAYLFRASFKNI